MNASEPVAMPVTSFTATRKIAAATLTIAVRRRRAGVGELAGGPVGRRRSSPASAAARLAQAAEQ